MEDSQYSLTISIYQKPRTLTLDDFKNQSPLVLNEHIPSRLLRPSQQQIQVINIIHRTPLENYERIIQQSISPFYIKNNMKLKIYQYSYVCSSILCVNVYECVHIVHYLIYGCFASASYVNMVVDTKGEAQAQKKERPKVEKKSKIQSQKQIFLKDLEDVLKIKTIEESEVKVEEENYNKRIVHNPYQIRLPNVDGRQTSPMISLLRKKNFEPGSTIRISKKIRHKDNSKLINSLFSHSVNNKTNIIPSQKKTIQNKRISLKGLLELKQKLKSDNQFLDQLRVSLTCSQSHFRQFRSRQPFQPNVQRIDLKLSQKIESCKPLQQISVQPQLTMQLPQKKNEPVPNTNASGINNQNEVQDESYNLKFMSSTQKIPFRSKLNFYKKEYRQFLHSRSKNISVS